MSPEVMTFVLMPAINNPDSYARFGLVCPRADLPVPWLESKLAMPEARIIHDKVISRW